MKGSFIPFMLVILGIITPVVAHQPFFEDKEFTIDNPGHIKDPTISTAMYAALETPTNVDYYSFNGSIGQVILLSITIPQIAGQENFTPAMALMGPGLPPGDLPKKVIKPTNAGIIILPPQANATPFFEPFSRTSYWTRQEQNITLPANGSYLVAVWDDKEQIGRYVFVIGYKEVLGGDPAFPIKIKSYWKPLVPLSEAQSSAVPPKTPANASMPGFEMTFALMGLVVTAYKNLKKKA